MSAKTQPVAADDAKERAKQVRAKLAHRPGVEDVEPGGGVRFSNALRSVVAKLKAARESAGLTLAQLAAKTGLAEETLSRLETGAARNPTWKTLGDYAVAVGLRLSIDAD